MRQAPRLVVVGGGIAGLTAAYRLLHPRHADGPPAASGSGPRPEVILLEAGPRLGGKIRTDVVEGFVVEAGPDSLLATKPWGVDLAADVGIKGELRGTDPSHRRAFVQRRGRLYPLPEGLSGLVPIRLAPMFRSSLLSPVGRIRLALETVVPRRRRGGEESVASFVRRRFGREAYDWLMEPLLSGIYAGSGEELGIRASFPRLEQAEAQTGSVIRGLRVQARQARPTGEFETPFVAPAEGMERFVVALAGALGQADIRLETSARRIVRIGDALGVEAGGGETIEADAVVVTAPAWSAGNIVGDLSPDLAASLGAIPFRSVAIVSIAHRAEDIGRPLEGYGYLNPRSAKRTVTACSWSSSKFHGRAPPGAVLLRAFVGRDHEAEADGGEAEAETGEDAIILAAVADELRDVLGIRAAPLWTRVHRWPRAMPQYVVGHAETVRAVERALSAVPGLFLAGHSYHGVGIPDTIRTAEEAARSALAYLRIRREGKEAP